MPDLQDDRLALVGRKAPHRVECGLLLGRRFGGRFEPSMGLDLAPQPTPEGAPMVQGPVAEGSNQVESGFPRRLDESKEGSKGIVENVFGLGMAQPKGATVENQFGGARIVKRLCPVRVFGFVRSHFEQ